MKTQKGITLVALVITIIVLLILAVVAIGAVRDSGIIGHAQNAASEYNKAKEAEESAISEYESLIESKLPKEDNETQTPPEPAELNFWQKKGMTSGNVRFDTLYWVEELDYKDWGGLTFGFYNNGDMCFNLEKNTTANTVPIKDKNGNNNLGKTGVRKEEVETTYADVFTTLPNGITIPVGENAYMTIKYTADNTIKVYIGDDLTNDGHVPEETTYYAGELIPQ